MMGAHPFSGASPPDVLSYDPDGHLCELCFVGYRDFRELMVSAGDDKPIWLTEFGWSTTTNDAWGVTLAQQADYLTRAYQVVEQDPYVQVAIYYNLRNNWWSKDANTWEDKLGLLRTNFTPKPGYYSFVAVPATGTGT